MKTQLLARSILLLYAITPFQAGNAQGTRADYDRANGLGRLVQGKVLNLSIEPHWIDNGSRFWYRRDLPAAKHEFMLVDPPSGTKQPAFDHKRLAEALSKALGKAVEADKLPIDRMAFPADKPGPTIQVKDKAFTVNLQTYELQPTDSLPPTPTENQRGFRGGGGQFRGSRSSSSSPDKKWTAIIREYNVFVKDASSGQETQLTSDGAATDRYESPFHWSPDSSKLVVMRTIPAQEHKVYTVESSPRDQLQPKLHTNEYLKPGDQIAHPRPHLFEVAAHKNIPISEALFANPWEITEVHWAPDSKSFTFLYNQRGHQVMRLVSVNAETGEARAAIDEQAKTFIDWTNKVYLHPIEKSGEAIWMSERDGWNHLYLYDLAAEKVKNQITKGEWVVRYVDKVDEEKRQIFFRAGGVDPKQDPYYIHFCRVNFDGTGFADLSPADGNHRRTYSPDNAFCIDTCSRVDMPPFHVLCRTDDGKKVCDLEKADAVPLLSSGWKYPERFVSKARDGNTDIYGVICRPSNFDPKRKYPVIENIYAGPQGAFVPKAFSPMSGLQAMAELGFIVVQIDGMGTNFRSKAFHDVCCKNLGDAGFPDRLLWIKTAGAKYPQMDLTRVGIYGTSAGGQNALGGILQYPEFYKACVSDCGCHDNRMDKVWWNEQWMGYPVGDHYAEQSNVTMAPRLKGKLLLMVGELDTNVDPASTMQVVNALIKANKDFDLLVVPGAGHGVAGSPYGRRKLQDFFVRSLLGVTPPDRNAG